MSNRYFRVLSPPRLVGLNTRRDRPFHSAQLVLISAIAVSLRKRLSLSLHLASSGKDHR